MYGEKLTQYEKGLDYLRRRGYKIIEGASVQIQHGYLAGTDQERADDFNNMFRNPLVRAIFCSRGGYGCSRILPLLDYQTCSDAPRIFVGYSDITTLQMALYSKSGLVTFSGPMIAMDMGPGLDHPTEHFFWQQMTNKDRHVIVSNEFGIQPTIFSEGIADGPLLGGCLTAINSLIGTSFLPDLTGCILALEDIGEDVYKIDRYLAQLTQAGILQKVNGIVFGQFVDCDSGKNEKPTLTLDEVIHHYVNRLHIPVMANFPFGHGKSKITLPIGCRVRIDTRRGELRMLEEGLRNVKKN